MGEEEEEEEREREEHCVGEKGSELVVFRRDGARGKGRATER